MAHSTPTIRGNEGNGGSPRAGSHVPLRASRHTLDRRDALQLGAVALLGCVAPGAPASAAVSAKQGNIAPPRRTAFVIGNSNYRNVPKLPNPRRDAAAISTKLKQIGFEVTTVIDGDQVALDTALASFSKSSRGSDIALFFFAGHGIQINGENYLLPISVKGSTADAVLRQGLSLNDVRRRFRAAAAGLSIFVLDSCRDNPFGSLATKRTGETAAPLVIGQGMAQMQSAAGMLIAYATQPGRLAYDGDGKHSPFTTSLLRYLGEPGLEIRLMLGRVREDVVAKTGGAQIPWVEEAVLGEFYFSEKRGNAAGALTGGKADDVTFWRSIWRSSDRRDYEAYLAQFPDGAFAALAANRIQALRTSARPAMALSLETSSKLDTEQWRLVQNSLYWLGYYNGKLTGVADNAVVNALQAFQIAAYEKPSVNIGARQIRRLHDAAAASLIALGERLSDRIVFDRTRLLSIERGIDEIALPAYKELVRKLAGVPDGRKILAETKQQLDAMRRQRDAVGKYFEGASQDYLTVVAAAGAGYADQVRRAQFGQVRAGGIKGSKVKYLASRRRIFLKHALDYSREGRINEKQWLDEIR